MLTCPPPPPHTHIHIHWAWPFSWEHLLCLCCSISSDGYIGVWEGGGGGGGTMPPTKKKQKNNVPNLGNIWYSGKIKANLGNILAISSSFFVCPCWNILSDVCTPNPIMGEKNLQFWARRQKCSRVPTHTTLLWNLNTCLPSPLRSMVLLSPLMTSCSSG